MVDTVPQPSLSIIVFLVKLDISLRYFIELRLATRPGYWGRFWRKLAFTCQLQMRSRHSPDDPDPGLA